MENLEEDWGNTLDDSDPGFWEDDLGDKIERSQTAYVESPHELCDSEQADVDTEDSSTDHGENNEPEPGGNHLNIPEECIDGIARLNDWEWHCHLSDIERSLRNRYDPTSELISESEYEIKQLNNEFNWLRKELAKCFLTLVVNTWLTEKTVTIRNPLNQIRNELAAGNCILHLQGIEDKFALEPGHPRRTLLGWCVFYDLDIECNRLVESGADIYPIGDYLPDTEESWDEEVSPSIKYEPDDDYLYVALYGNSLKSARVILSARTTQQSCEIDTLEPESLLYLKTNENDVQCWTNCVSSTGQLTLREETLGPLEIQSNGFKIGRLEFGSLFLIGNSQPSSVASGYVKVHFVEADVWKVIPQKEVNSWKRMPLSKWSINWGRAIAKQKVVQVIDGADIPGLELEERGEDAADASPEPEDAFARMCSAIIANTPAVLAAAKTRS